MPCLRASSRKEAEVYWLPRSLWKIRPAAGWRIPMAIARALQTRLARIWSARAKPTTRRLGPGRSPSPGSTSPPRCGRRRCRPPRCGPGRGRCRSFAAPGPEPARRRAGRGLVVLESPSPAASQPSEGHQAGYTLPRAGMALPPQLLVHSWGTVRPTAFPVDGGHPLAELAVPAGMADGRPWDHW